MCEGPGQTALGEGWELVGGVAGRGLRGPVPSPSSSLLFQPVFHVMGFSVTGRVLNGPEGEGVPDAVVTLNSQIKGGQPCWPGPA